MITIQILIYRVQRTVLQSAADAQAVEKSKKKGAGGGLDSVLSTIKGPKAVSTVVKSSMDWDVYKEKEGLEEDLQAAAKDGYVIYAVLLYTHSGNEGFQIFAIVSSLEIFS